MACQYFINIFRALERCDNLGKLAIVLVHLLEPFVQRVVGFGRKHTALDLGQCARVHDNLKHAHKVSRRQASVRVHLQVKTI